MRGALRTFGAAIAMTAAVVTAPAAAAAGPPVPTLDWRPCGDQFPGFECTVAAVPLDYDNPRGATTSIALSRKPATDRAHRIGSVFLNPGGPGGSGFNFALGFGNRLSAALNGRFDVVGFDPRGIGRSDPLHCFASGDDENAFLGMLPF